MGVALGCMRLSTDADRDTDRSFAAIAAALDAGVRFFDTARAYGLGEADLGHNERLLASAVGDHDVRIATKGGMSRAAGMWHPDGRARVLREDAEASVVALGRAPDLWLLHAPDPRTPWATSVRAMAAILRDGHARAVGVCNVTRAQLEEALDLVPIAAVSVALGPFDDAALRGGVVELCASRGVAVLAHAPLGGPARAGKLAADPVLAALAAERGASAVDVALAWLRTLGPEVVPVVGARRPETARALATELALDDDARARLAERFPSQVFARPRARPSISSDGEVVLVMGVPGAGKTRAAAEWTARGYHRLNRDDRGGDLRGLARDLDAVLASGARRAVLDNTYVTRASRAEAIEVAHRHGVAVRGVWLDTPPAQAQVNLCTRMIDAVGALPEPEALRRSRTPGVMPPTQHMRVCRQVELPRLDEGFAAIDVVPFARHADPSLSPGRVIALGAMAPGDAVPTLAIAWRPAGEPVDDIAGADMGICSHPGGPPTCWCRPPLPGLVVAWARRRSVDLARLTVVGPAPTFRTLAAAFGASYREAP
jgi:aryl-alcohol dehydrogenase-like predicted oxidoreductase